MVVGRIGSLAAEVVTGGLATARVVLRSGAAAPVRPDRLVSMLTSARKWGLTPATLCAVNAARDPHRLAVIDERESVTYAEIDRRSSIVAARLGQLGVGEGDVVALLARNSAAFVVAQVAVGKLGADLVYVNTGFAGPQLGDVLDSESVTAVIADDEFRPLVEEVAGSRPRLTAWVGDGAESSDISETGDSIASLVADHGTSATPQLPSPSHEGRHIILTSGTTGRPKGAARGVPGSLAAVVGTVALLDAIPYRGRATTLLAAPAFHAWGLGNLILGMALQSTFVMARRFDPEVVTAQIEEHAVDALVAVPVMASRLLEAPQGPDTSSLRIVALSGSALPSTLAEQFMDRFGDVLYSLYGSTEVAYVSVAGPADLRKASGTAGRVLRGVVVRIVDDQDADVESGEVGRIFVGSGMAFDGYTSGEDKGRLGKLASIGDVGRLDKDGLLFIEGRDDDMIVSGGENVFPAEVEDTLAAHEDVADVAVVGVDDEKFGQALVAYVVRRSGSTVTEEKLRQYVKGKLAGYKVPREVVFLDELPRNETGKVVKRELKELAQPDEKRP